MSVRLLFKSIRFIVIIPLVGLTSLFSWAWYKDHFPSPIPQFLVGVNSEGSDWTSCPQKGRLFTHFDFPPKGNLVINARLDALFSVGTEDQNIRKRLESEGFRMNAPCADYISVKSATFLQERYSLTRTDSIVVWKVDKSQKVLWIKGGLFYFGL